ncbi:lytic murein transglycosylase [Mesorhizobium sp. M9A.F.Ca.ET.002.03.1.2]|nr:lytic murein transglycosylase [Mesorhizobium sp. M9A.F.Ca.ET.002.03.1.2]
MAGQHPLCPAGHLPLKGGDYRSTAFANHKRWRAGGAPKLPISPLEGEMSGRTEGGASHDPPPLAARSASPA